MIRLLFIPILLIGFFECIKAQQPMPDIPPPPQKGVPQSDQQSNRDSSRKSIFTYVEQMPEFPGGQTELVRFLSGNLKYPDSARSAGIEGRVVLQFIVGKDGSISDVMVLRDIGGGCAAEAVRVVKMMPRWTPGKQNGNPVDVYFKLPVSFRLNEPDLTKAGITTPSYPKGEDSLHMLIQKNLQYPKEAKKKKISGIVVLSFDVDENGKAQNAKVYKSLGYGCDEEAIRIFNLIPEWTPGTKEGRAVAMPYYIEVNFNLKK